MEPVYLVSAGGTGVSHICQAYWSADTGQNTTLESNKRLQQKKWKVRKARRRKRSNSSCVFEKAL